MITFFCSGDFLYEIIQYESNTTSFSEIPCEDSDGLPHGFPKNKWGQLLEMSSLWDVTVGSSGFFPKIIR